MQKYMQAAETIRSRTALVPEIAIVLGSGLGGFAERVENAVSVEYGDIPGFPRSTVPGHHGRFLIGCVEGQSVIVLDGRVH